MSQDIAEGDFASTPETERWSLPYGLDLGRSEIRKPTFCTSSEVYETLWHDQVIYLLSFDFWFVLLQASSWNFKNVGELILEKKQIRVPKKMMMLTLCECIMWEMRVKVHFIQEILLNDFKLSRRIRNRKCKLQRYDIEKHWEDPVFI